MAGVDGRALLSRNPLVDGHNDLAWALRARAAYDWDLSVERPELHTDIPRLRRGGVGAQFWSVYVACSSADPVRDTLEQIDAVHRFVARHPSALGLATTADELLAVYGSGRVASLLGAEGGHSIASSLGVLRMLYALGVRYLTLTHNENVPWADSATDEPAVGGLSAFGVDVVREMNRLGMLVDCSHMAESTMRAALAASTAPILFSHSSAYALCDHPRNVPDDVLTAMAAAGGVCMVTFVPKFVAQDCADWQRAADAAALVAGVDVRDIEASDAWDAAYEQRHPRPVATVQQVADHVCHVRDVAGVGGVGIGGDFDGTTAASRLVGRLVLPGARRRAARAWLVRIRPRRPRRRQRHPRPPRRRGRGVVLAPPSRVGRQATQYRTDPDHPRRKPAATGGSHRAAAGPRRGRARRARAGRPGRGRSGRGAARGRPGRGR